MMVATLSMHMDDELRRMAQVVYCANGVFHPITSIRIHDGCVVLGDDEGEPLPPIPAEISGR